MKPFGWCTRWNERALCIASRDAASVLDCNTVACGSKSFSPRLGIFASSCLSNSQRWTKSAADKSDLRHCGKESEVLYFFRKIDILRWRARSGDHIFIYVLHDLLAAQQRLRHSLSRYQVVSLFASRWVETWKSDRADSIWKEDDASGARTVYHFLRFPASSHHLCPFFSTLTLTLRLTALLVVEKTPRLAGVVPQYSHTEVKTPAENECSDAR